jgi:alpha-tubulin suppressor-like RCC1 family protein
VPHARVKGELGDGQGSFHSPTPVTAIDLPSAIGVDAGYATSYAIVSGGAVWSWGDGTLSTLAVSVGDFYFAPVESLVTSGVVQASGGCFRFANDELRCCGGAPVGDGTFTTRITPVPVLGVAEAVDLSREGLSACAVRPSGRVACWGENEDGQLGTGAYGADRLRPFPVPGLP